MTASLPPAVRRLVLATLVDALGNGLYFAVGALYLTRAAGLSVGHVGIGLTVAGLVGLVTSTPLGTVADRLGPNRAYVGFLLLQAITMAALTQVRLTTVAIAWRWRGWLLTALIFLTAGTFVPAAVRRHQAWTVDSGGQRLEQVA